MQEPIIDSGRFSCEHIYVADQQRNDDSLLDWFAHAIHVRKICPGFGRRECDIIQTRVPHVLARGT